MKQDIEVLECVISGIDMGINAIDEVLKDIESEPLKVIMIDQNRAYKSLKEECEQYLLQENREEENKHVMSTIMLKSMIKMKTMMNHDDHKIAKMLIEGSTQAIISMQSLLNDYPNTSQTVKDYCEQFLNLSKEHINQWKEYL